MWRIDVTCCDLGLIGPWRSGDEEVLYINFGDPQVFYFQADSLASGGVEFKVVRRVDMEEDCTEPEPVRPVDTPTTWGWMKHNLLIRAEAESVCP